MMRGNLHTHTTYCDGNYTPEEIVKTAIDKGFSYIGFSGHSYTFFDETYAMTKENTDKYFDDVNLQWHHRSRDTNEHPPLHPLQR